MRARRKSPAKLRRGKDFNPRAHEGTTISMVVAIWLALNFNPRAHEGTTCFTYATFLRYVKISIHVPMRARLLCRGGQAKPVLISIHVPMRARLPVDKVRPAAVLLISICELLKLCRLIITSYLGFFH